VLSWFEGLREKRGKYEDVDGKTENREGSGIDGLRLKKIDVPMQDSVKTAVKSREEQRKVSKLLEEEKRKRQKGTHKDREQG
jgi:hypothetical protein